MKKSSGPGTPWGNLNRMEDIAWEDRRLNPQPASLCDGCFTRFIGFPKKAHDDFEEDDNRDPVAKYKHCNDCDWTICEACTRPENQGRSLSNPIHSLGDSNPTCSGTPIIDRPPGTCRCPTSNFGVSYCLSGPSYLDGDNANRTPYRGDRHPPIAGSGYDENAYEAKERACRTCGVIARCLKKERLKDAAPGMQ